jgi:HEPN domain-containing protein
MTKYRFKKVPANLGLVKLNGNKRLVPNDIYEYAKSFRSVFMRSMPLLKQIANLQWATQEEITQLYGKAQSLAVQIAMSNELLLKAILFASIGKLKHGHNLKELINSLDKKHVEIIKAHLRANGLKADKWDKVLDMSALTYLDARYGFEGKEYVLDFRTLQLLNEVLDDIFNNFVPDWKSLTYKEQNDHALLKKKTDLILSDS